MKKLVFLLILVLPVVSSGAAGRIVSYNSEREPQVISFQEDPDSRDSILYKFCLSEELERRGDCKILGRGEKRSLSRAKIANANMKKVMTYLQPIAFITTILVTGYIAFQTGGTTIAFLAGSGSYLITDLVYLESYDPRLFSELSVVLNPKASAMGASFILPEGISIVDFSYRLEEELNSIKEYQESYRAPINDRTYYYDEASNRIHHSHPSNPPQHIFPEESFKVLR